MARGGVLLKLVELPIFNAVTVNPDFGCVEWPGGVDLCPDAMHQAMTGSAAEVELPSPLALRDDAEKNREGNQAGGFFKATCHAEIRPVALESELSRRNQMKADERG